MISGIDVVMYFVKDLDRARSFYRGKLGLRMTMPYGDDGEEYTLDDGSTFGVYRRPDGVWFHGGGVTFGVRDIRRAVENLLTQGVEIANNGEILEMPACYLAFAEDSEGNSFMLHQRKT
jgi:catechol 2,3-dioxygenase-like lactoylglutathione lyase family enzyme